MIIGLSGTNLSGKDTVADYFATHNFEVVSLSDILREELRSRDLEITRPALIELANHLENEQGAGSLARIAIEKNGHKSQLVISSIRKPSEVDTLKEHDGFTLIFVDAPIKTRYKRTIERAREGEEKISLEEFMEIEAIEFSGQSSQHLGYCKEMADIVLENNGELEDLHRKIDRIIEKEVNLS